MRYSVIMINDQPEHVSLETDMVKLEVLRKEWQRKLDKEDAVKSSWQRKRFVRICTVDGDEPMKDIILSPRQQLDFSKAKSDEEIIDLGQDDYAKD